MRQLEVLDAVGREGSVTAAAAALHLTQPAVSMQLKQLEDQLELSLFESVGRGLALVMGVFLLALSFVMPRIRRNPVLGIRLAWTLASDENWARTHRFASYTFAAAGVVALAGALLGGPSAGPVSIVALLAGALAPAVYSYFVARGEA